MNRRRFLLGTTGLFAFLAGCNTTTEADPDITPDTATTAVTSARSPEIAIGISTTAGPEPLPSIWADQRIDQYTAEFRVERSGEPSQLSVRTDRVELTQASAQWTDNSVTIQPGQLLAGEQAVTATARKNDVTVTDTATVDKATPGTYKLDVVPERNEQLRQTIREASDAPAYLAQRGGFTRDDPVFRAYSSHEALSFDKLGADLVALEWRHDNDYENIEDGVAQKTQEFIDSIGTDTGNQTIQDIKSGRLAINAYPNGSGQAGSFEYQEFANAETVGEALDWLHPYYFNWNRFNTDSGPISSEDAIYAPTLEQAIEKKNNNDLEVHAWDFDLDEHGNGLIYGRDADGSDELRIMETVSKPVTSTPQTRGSQLHPLVEDSNYLNPDHDEFNRYWHPLRFGWEEHSNSTRWNFEQEKRRAGQIIQNIATSAHLARTSGEGSGMETTETVAPTTEYLQDFTEKLRTYNQNNADFQELHNQAKIANELIRKDTGENYVIYGDTENPQYAVVEDESVIEDIWEDEEGQYDDFNQFLRDISSESVRARAGAAATARQ